MSRKLVFLGVTAMISVVGCGKIDRINDEIKEVRKISEEVRDIGTSINDTAKQVQAVGNRIDLTAAQVDKVLREILLRAGNGLAAQIRIQSIENLRREPSITLKGPHAIAYMNGLDFQTMSSDSWNNPIIRDAYFNLAMTEVLARTRGFLDGSREFQFSSRSNERLNLLAAWAFALDWVSVFQQELALTDPKFRPVSAHGLIEEALCNTVQVSPPALATSQWKQTVLEWPEEARFLLRARALVLIGVVIEDLSNDVDKGIFAKTSLERMFIWPFTVNFNTFTPQRIRRLTEFLRMSDQQFRVLRNCGGPLRDPFIAKILSHIKIEVARGSSNLTGPAAEFESAVRTALGNLK